MSFLAAWLAFAGAIPVPGQPGRRLMRPRVLWRNALARGMEQPFIVDNRAGAGGAIGSDAVAKSAPDGYTLLAASTGSVTVNPLLSRRTTTRKVLRRRGVIATVPYGLVMPIVPRQRCTSTHCTIARKSGKYSFASSGNGSIGHHQVGPRPRPCVVVSKA